MSEPMSEARIQELREWNRGGADEVDELLDEVERLRAALKELSGRGLQALRRVARAALGHDGKGQK